jgi:hypothetical protein
MATNKIQKFEMSARIRTDVPDFAVDTGEAMRALAALGGSLSGRLRQMADEAKREEDAKRLEEAGAAGRPVGIAAADSFVAQRAGLDAATARAASIPEELDVHIRTAADRYGVSADTLRMIAGIESGGNVSAQNPNSSAGGPFQFVDGTAKDYGLADRFDPAQASDAAARLLLDNAAMLRKTLGREPTPAELYLAHQQGGQGAANLLSNPTARAADIVGQDAITLNGGTTDMTAADFANIWLAKAGGGQVQRPGSSSAQVEASALSTVPLQLRKDGTPAGEAFDDAAIQAYGWRVMAQLSEDLGRAAIENQDNPSGYAQAAQAIQQKYLQEEAFGEPELRELFDKVFVEKTTADRLHIASRHETKLRQEQVSAAGAGLDATSLELERHAYNLGAYGQGDAVLNTELSRAFAQIQGMQNAGVLTPDQANTRRQDLTETVFRSRVEGTYDQLDTPAEKQNFARQILTDYEEGKGPFGVLSLDEVKSLSGELFRRATADANALTIEQMQERARVAALAEDDIASLLSTGQPLDFNANGVRPSEIQAILGPEDFAVWQENRRKATETWESTSQMRAMSEAEIASYLAGIAPQAGQPGFAGQQQTHDAAQDVAAQILKARSDDPAGYAYSNFPQVQAAWEQAATAKTPEAYRQAIGQTLNVQRQLGIAQPQPLPRPQAQLIADAFTNPQLPEEERIRALTDVVFATSDADQQGLIFEQLVTSGVDGMASGALGAWVRGDLEAARRLFQASLVDPEKRPGKVPETTSAISEEIQRRIMAPGAIGDVYYGISGGTAESFLTAERDNKLLQRAVQERLLRGEGLGAAVDGAAADLFGDIVPVRGGWQVNAEILLPRDEDPQPYLTGLAELTPRVRAALESAFELPSLAAPDGSMAVEPGNIDLLARPVVENDDGTISTVRSMSFAEDGFEILIPMVSPEGKVLDEAAAIQLYRDTGQHLGKFRTPADATTYALALHDRQQALYDRSTGAAAIFGGVTANYVESVLSEGAFRSVRDGFVFIDPFTATAVAGADGQAIIFTEAEVLAAGKEALARNAANSSDQDRELRWLQQQSATFGMMGSGVAP